MQLFHHLLSSIPLVLFLLTQPSTQTKSTNPACNFPPLSFTTFDDQFWIEVVFQPHIPQPVDDYKNRPFGTDDPGFRLRAGNSLRIDQTVFAPSNGGTFQKVVVTVVFHVADFFQLEDTNLLDRNRISLEIWSDALSVYTYPGFNPIAYAGDTNQFLDRFGTTDFNKSPDGLGFTIVKACVPSKSTTRLELRATRYDGGEIFDFRFSTQTDR